MKAELIDKKMLNAALTVIGQNHRYNSDVELLKKTVLSIPGARWKDFMQFHVFVDIDWGDGSEPSVDCEMSASGTSLAWENAEILLTVRRAEELQFESAKVLRKIKKTFRLCYQVQHVSDDRVSGFLNVETGEFRCGLPWQRAETKRLADVERLSKKESEVAP